MCEHYGQRQAVDPVTGHDILKPSPSCMKEIGEIECGHCTYIVSNKEIFIGEAPKNRFNGKPWSQLRSESVYLPSKESYAPLATYIINACKKMNCDSEVTKFKVKLGKLSAVQEKK